MSKHSSTEKPTPGSIGYRTRGGRTGLDPIDSQLESSRMEGVFFRKLFTGRLRTHKPLYLVIMAALAILFLLFPLAGILSDSKNLSRPDAIRDQVLVPIICLWPLGLAFLVNLVLSLTIHHDNRHN